MVNTADSIRSLFIPVDGANLVLPNAAVAEIIPYEAPEPVAGAPDWLIGMLKWRDLRIPVVSFEAVAGGASPAPGARARLAVINTVGASPKLKFYALLTREIPHLLRADDTTVGVAAEQGKRAPAVLGRVTVHGQAAVIPDLEAIEKMLERAV